MTTSSLKPMRKPVATRARKLCLAAALAASLVAPNTPAQAPAAAPTDSTVAVSAQQLEALVGRIALYPDDLIGIVLPASTNPLQIVQADRFLDKRKTQPGLVVDERWDAAVKSLLNYPEVVKSMSGDLDWTTALGEAVVADQGQVLDAIQAFRRKTQGVGNLKSDSKQIVVVEKEVIRIVQADPQVIYVPQYNPTTVVVYGGYSTWGYYPSPYPVYYYPYPPGAAFATGLIWGAAISATWHGGHYVAHYGGSANININRNVNINSGNINVNRPGAPQPQVDSSAWKPSKQAGQVGGGLGATPRSRVGDVRPAGGPPTAAALPAPSAPRAPQAAPRTQPSQLPAAGNAFEGYGSGRQAQLDSSRGAGSRQARAGGRAGGHRR